MHVISLKEFGNGDHFHLDEVPTPHPQTGEVRIRIKATSFNPVDCKTRQGKYGGNLPLILGCDCSGIIDAIGGGVTQFKIGDPVYALAFGQCSNGTYAEYVCLPHEFVAKKPLHLSFESAACIPLTTLTAYRATTRAQNVPEKGTFFVAGAAGGVGCMALQLLNHFYDIPIYTVARREATATFLVDKLNIKENHIVMSKDIPFEDVQDRLIELNEGHLFAATFDFVGNEMKSLCVSLTNYSGHIVSIVPEQLDFKSPVWSQGSPYFSRSLSSHSIFVGAESFFGTRETWKIYQYHLTEINRLLGKQVIDIPYYKNLGSFCVKTVQNAHKLLESGTIHGKLVMSVD